MSQDTLYFIVAFASFHVKAFKDFDLKCYLPLKQVIIIPTIIAFGIDEYILLQIIEFFPNLAPYFY